MKSGWRCSALGRGKQLAGTSLTCRELAHDRLERRDTAGDGQRQGGVGVSYNWVLVDWRGAVDAGRLALVWQRCTNLYGRLLAI